MPSKVDERTAVELILKTSSHHTLLYQPLTPQTAETTARRCYRSFLDAIHLPARLPVQIAGLVLS